MGWRRHTGAGTFAPQPDPSRLLEGQPPPTPCQASCAVAAAVPGPLFNANHVLHPQLIVQQASVDLPPSGPPSWLGTWGPVTVSKD